MKDESLRNRRELLENYEDSLFRLVMHDVAEEEGRTFIEENDELKCRQKEKPSSEALSKFGKLYNRNAPKRTGRHSLRTSRTFNKIAVILIVIAVCLTSMVTVDAIRIRVMNLLIAAEKQFTSIRLTPEQKPKMNGILPNASWSGCYMPTYIPQGFQLVYESNKDVQKSLMYQNEEGLVIHYMQFDASAEVNIDTEDADAIKNMKVNSSDGLLVIKDGLTSICWSDQMQIFLITSQADQEQTVEIAESVKIVK